MTNKLVYYGNEILRKVAEEVSNINQEDIDLVDYMFKIMHQENGIGLAAPQINISKRILVLDLKVYKGPSMMVINPKILDTSDETEQYDEGCLSLPGISGEIYRPSQISIQGLNSDGKEVQIEADGMLARVLQHEIDHLNGILFIDHLEDFIKKEYTSELKKIKKLNKLS